MNNIILAFILTFMAGMATFIGFFFLLLKQSKKLIAAALAFASSIMLGISISDLIPEGLALFRTKYNLFLAILLLVIFIVLGINIAIALDKFFPEKNNNKLYKVGIITSLALIAHNIPEGIITFLSATNNISLGISLTIAIALHNIPEGISIIVPIYYATGKKNKAIYLLLIAALAEPFGAFIAYIFLQNIITDTLLAIFFATIAGIMGYISIFNLLKESISYKEKKTIIYCFLLGTIIIIIDFLFLN